MKPDEGRSQGRSQFPTVLSPLTTTPCALRAQGQTQDDKEGWDRKKTSNWYPDTLLVKPLTQGRDGGWSPLSLECCVRPYMCARFLVIVNLLPALSSQQSWSILLGRALTPPGRAPGTRPHLNLLASQGCHLPVAGGHSRCL